MERKEAMAGLHVRGNETAVVWVKGIRSGAGQALQPWPQANLHRNPSPGVWEGLY